MKETDKFFGETAYYIEGSREQKKEAEDYLKFWKKNLLFKLKRDSFHCEVVDEQYHERPAYLCGMLAQNACISLKLCLRAVFNYEI